VRPGNELASADAPLVQQRVEARVVLEDLLSARGRRRIRQSVAQAQQRSTERARRRNQVVCHHKRTRGRGRRRPLAQRWQRATKGHVWPRAHDPAVAPLASSLGLHNVCRQSRLPPQCERPNEAAVPKLLRDRLPLAGGLRCIDCGEQLLVGEDPHRHRPQTLLYATQLRSRRRLSFASAALRAGVHENRRAQWL